MKGWLADGGGCGVGAWEGLEAWRRSWTEPRVAASHGIAVGGGVGMTMDGDVRLAADNARLGQPEVSIAFIPPIATTQALVRLIGRPRTLKYLYEGRLVKAAEAHAWGLVDELCEPDQLRSDVQEYAEGLTKQSATALAAIRRTVTIGGGMTFDDGMQLELETASALADTADFAEGIDAFLTKRTPRWERH